MQKSNHTAFLSPLLLLINFLVMFCIWNSHFFHTYWVTPPVLISMDVHCTFCVTSSKNCSFHRLQANMPIERFVPFLFYACSAIWRFAFFTNLKPTIQIQISVLETNHWLRVYNSKRFILSFKKVKKEEVFSLRWHRVQAFIFIYSFLSLFLLKFNLELCSL